MKITFYLSELKFKTFRNNYVFNSLVFNRNILRGSKKVLFLITTLHVDFTHRIITTANDLIYNTFIVPICLGKFAMNAQNTH